MPTDPALTISGGNDVHSPSTCDSSEPAIVTRVVPPRFTAGGETFSIVACPQQVVPQTKTTAKKIAVRFIKPRWKVTSRKAGFRQAKLAGGVRAEFALSCQTR